MRNNMETITSIYKQDLINAINHLESDRLHVVANKLLEARKNGKSIFLMGNGGSSATPSHSAGDWAKELKLKTICITDNIPAVTAFANDTDYSNIFKGQLETFLSEGDIVIGYSGSGNSPNVLNAIEYTKMKGNYTIGITGNYKEKMGGKLAQIADISIIAQTTSMERIEDMHLIINHIIKEYVKESNTL